MLLFGTALTAAAVLAVHARAAWARSNCSTNTEQQEVLWFLAGLGQVTLAVALAAAAGLTHFAGTTVPLPP